MTENSALYQTSEIPLRTGKPQITMAPLIDVVFLLLIFFVVATVFPDDHGIKINKPATHNIEYFEKTKLVFILTSKGEIFFQNDQFQNNLVDIKDVHRIAKDHGRIETNIVAIIQPDKQATTEYLIQLMDAIKTGGIEHIGIATDVLPEER